MGITESLRPTSFFIIRTQFAGAASISRSLTQTFSSQRLPSSGIQLQAASKPPSPPDRQVEDDIQRYSLRSNNFPATLVHRKQRGTLQESLHQRGHGKVVDAAAQSSPALTPSIGPY